MPQVGFAKATEVASLNESQSTLLMMYMRNTEIVRDFKKRLVKAFYILRDQANAAIVAPVVSTTPEVPAEVAPATEVIAVVP